jgi:leucyl aminopeptidase
MTIINKEAEFLESSCIAILLGKGTLKKNQVDSFQSKESLELFLKSDKKFDFVKTENRFVFLVKEDQKSEELRVLGSKIQGFIADSHERISILGKEKAVISLAEGIALSNYQFNRFFSKPKSNKLNTILIES